MRSSKREEAFGVGVKAGIAGFVAFCTGGDAGLAFGGEATTPDAPAAAAIARGGAEMGGAEMTGAGEGSARCAAARLTKKGSRSRSCAYSSQARVRERFSSITVGDYHAAEKCSDLFQVWILVPFEGVFLRWNRTLDRSFGELWERCSALLCEEKGADGHCERQRQE